MRVTTGQALKSYQIVMQTFLPHLLAVNEDVHCTIIFMMPRLESVKFYSNHNNVTHSHFITLCLPENPNNFFSPLSK